ncbi:MULTISPECIES: TauD/TfdA family dioxygenase [Streptomyces]|uniref:TauD/TfdA-like domain-containing protein n=1 Tax=Streptomyces badius TaxID=1941 RepID=A0ABQ2SU46_STRBA|nr:MULTISPECIES: TauD/TfdA family dioxygenase [Streptomyces]GGS40482.1 hypothetical protein GCM10010253_12750 [Streptomyces badius]
MTKDTAEASAARPGPGPLPVVDLTGEPGSLADHRETLRATVAAYGAVLVRGSVLPDRAAAIDAARLLLTEPYEEFEGFAPRERYAPGVHSSSEWPSNQPMCMHHEASYALEVPSRLVFACLRAPESGGVTALADSHRVLADLPAGLVARFELLGWELRRHYNELIGVAWPAAFGSRDQAAVEAYCRANAIDFRWDEDGGLRTRQVRPAVLKHPDSGRAGWFNQIAFLNEWTMDPAVREYLALEFGEDGLPFTTRYGDGSPIAPETVELINEVYERHTVRVPWRNGDLMLVDNLRMAHSREPYKGSREIVVSMGDPVRR